MANNSNWGCHFLCGLLRPQWWMLLRFGGYAERRGLKQALTFVFLSCLKFLASRLGSNGEHTVAPGHPSSRPSASWWNENEKAGLLFKTLLCHLMVWFLIHCLNSLSMTLLFKRYLGPHLGRNFKITSSSLTSNLLNEMQIKVKCIASPQKCYLLCFLLVCHE